MLLYVGKKVEGVKRYRLILNLLTALPLAAALAALIFLPDEIPVHFGMDNLADRWGSKVRGVYLPRACAAGKTDDGGADQAGREHR